MGDATSDQSIDTNGRNLTLGSMREWLLLGANRRGLTAALLGLVFGVLLGLSKLDPSLEASLRTADSVETLFQSMVTAIITGVTLVVSINQLVLSQELGSVGDQREWMEGAMQYRLDAETHIEEPVSPSSPSTFLTALLESIERDARSLTTTAETMSVPAAADIEAYADAMITDTARVGKQFQATEFGTFEVVRTALEFNYSDKIYRGRWLKVQYEDELSDEQFDVLDDILDTIQLFGSGREHFKTLYFQWELINVSRIVLYSAIPALTTAVTMILYFDPFASVTGSTLGIVHVVWVVAAAFVVTASPFVLLVPYIVRITTVAKRTLAVGPFVLQDDETGTPTGVDTESDETA